MAHQQTLKNATRDLSKFTTKLAEETNQELNKLHRLVDESNEVLGAVVRLLGLETIEETIKEMREEKQALVLAKQKQGVQYLVDEKVLLPAETVEHPGGYIVGTDKLADGTERRVQFELAGVRPEFAGLYVSKKVGDVIESSTAKLTITEIYTIDRKRFEEVMAKPAEAEPTLEQPALVADTTDAAPAAQTE